MTTPTLIDRYVEAATRSVPDAQRADLATELRASIQDQVDARNDGGEPEHASVVAVLEDLGDPDALAAGYTDRPLHLIGPRYYLDWWRLLKLLLWIVLPLAAFGIVLGQLLSGATAGEVIGSAVSGTLGAALHIAFWTTLVFVVIERSTGTETAKPLTRWSVDQLPEPAASGAGRSDMIGTIVFLVIAGVALVWDQTRGLVRLDGQWLPFFDPGLWPAWIIGLLVVMALEIAVRVRIHLRRRWTMPLAAVNAAVNAVVTVPAVWLLAQDRLLNTEPWLAAIGDDGPTVVRIITIVTAVSWIGIAVWDSIDAVLKARRAR